MSTTPIDSVALIGDAGDVTTWSGTPYHFLQAAAAQGWRVQPWRLDMSRFSMARRLWNLGVMLRGRRKGGFQYSQCFLERAERQIPAQYFEGTVLSFSQFFPRPEIVKNGGGRLVMYIDATFPRLLERYGFKELMDAKTADEVLAMERRNYELVDHVIAFQRWTADSLVQECGVPREKVSTVLPGANIEIDDVAPAPRYDGIVGKDRPLVLGFVGKDWERKGLRFLVDVARCLERMGLRVLVRCAGGCPPDLMADRLVEYVGFISKQNSRHTFIDFIRSCDLGCLFSSAEASSIAILEYLRLGVPVAGFVVDGMGDLLLPEAALRFMPGQSSMDVAQEIIRIYTSDGALAGLRDGALNAGRYVTWERCLREISGVIR